MAGELVEKPLDSTIDLPKLKELVRAVIDEAAVVQAATPGLLHDADDVFLTQVALRVAPRMGQHDLDALLGLQDRRIDTISFDTVFAALAMGAQQAKAASAALGLPIAGRDTEH